MDRGTVSVGVNLSPGHLAARYGSHEERKKEKGMEERKQENS
jgi:hypothetical protein